MDTSYKLIFPPYFKTYSWAGWAFKACFTLVGDLIHFKLHLYIFPIYE